MMSLARGRAVQTCAVITLISLMYCEGAHPSPAEMMHEFTTSLCITFTSRRVHYCCLFTKLHMQTSAV